MDDDGESSQDKLPDNMVLDPTTGSMIPNPEFSSGDLAAASTPPSFEDILEPKSSRPKFKSNTPRKPKPNK